MRVILFGATGMVGRGVLLECLDSADVTAVLAVGRRASGVTHDKLEDLVLEDMHDYSGCREALHGYDACMFCVGVTAAGMSEEAYRRVTVDLAVAAGQALVAVNPGMTFCFVSGAGTDSSGKARAMWARVKGEAENALLAMGFPAAYMFRPAFIRPLRGVRSRTTLYRVLYAATGPLFPVFQALFPTWVTTSVQVGQAMIRVARGGWERPVLENPDINAAAGG